MWLFFELLLRVLHFIYAGALAAKLFWKRHSRPIPQPLTACRRRIPKHLSIIFAIHPTLSEKVAQEVLTESVVDAVAWCRTIGIKKLTVYEERDLLSKCVHGIRERLSVHSQEGYSSESETEYPITPPPSDCSESRPLSPDHSQGNVLPITIIRVGDSITHESSKSKQKLQRRQRRITEKHGNSPKSDILLCFASRDSSKPAIATVAQNLVRKQSRQSRRSNRTHRAEAFEISVLELDQLLEDDDALSAPDFMIVHHVEPTDYGLAPLELHGFPPWHIRLTEIYHSTPHKSFVQKWLRPYSLQAFPLDETSFRASLDEFALAEMRFGK